MSHTVKPKALFFGPGGTPLRSKDRSSLAGISVVNELGLGCMEMEFVHGVRMKTEMAKEVGALAKEKNVILTAHSPYYVNLNAVEQEKIDASIKRILDTARICNAAGGYSITFHAAFFLKQEPEKVYEKVRDNIKSIIQTLKDESNPIWVRPETTGKMTQLGSLKETISLSQDVEQVLPCIDFAHLHARDGKQNTYQEFCNILTEVEKGLGRIALDNMHCHVSGINYGQKGELNHLILKESDFNYKDLMKAFKDFKIKGAVICESPNLEDDAMLMRDTYNKL